MTDRSCMTCRHNTESPSPCGGCVFSPSLPKWEPQETAAETISLLFDPIPGADPDRGAPATRFAGLDGTGKENPKAQYGRAKPQLGLLPAAALIEMAGAMELGAIKYGAANWRDDPVESMTYAHAGLRHILSWIDGENIDPESGVSHLAHAMACFGIIMDAGHMGALLDNRPTQGAAGRLIRERTKAVG